LKKSAQMHRKKPKGARGERGTWKYEEVGSTVQGTGNRKGWKKHDRWTKGRRLKRGECLRGEDTGENVQRGEGPGCLVNGGQVIPGQPSLRNSQLRPSGVCWGIRDSACWDDGGGCGAVAT